jgi:hypothetical protein
MDIEVINQVFPQEGRVLRSAAARQVVEALGTNVGYLMTQVHVKSYLQFVDGIGFQIRNPEIKANYCRITITEGQTYTLWLAKVTIGERHMRVTTLCKVRNLGALTLQAVFEAETGISLDRDSSIVLKSGVPEVLAKQA